MLFNKNATGKLAQRISFIPCQKLSRNDGSHRDLDRPHAAKRIDGQPMYQRMCHRQNMNWSAGQKKEKKTYRYVPVVERIVNMRLDDEQ
ncbi:hypothetical protein LSAT2_019030 [Lamellibrachia satsuma]|nr:hypothetical protein LSAT2_019030 [Lamellibrachia satsuma]